MLCHSCICFYTCMYIIRLFLNIIIQHICKHNGFYSGGFDDCSATFVDNFETGIITSFQRLDHAVDRGITCNESYCWDFLSEDTDVYPDKADIVPGKV